MCVCVISVPVFLQKGCIFQLFQCFAGWLPLFYQYIQACLSVGRHRHQAQLLFQEIWGEFNVVSNPKKLRPFLVRMYVYPPKSIYYLICFVVTWSGKHVANCTNHSWGQGQGTFTNLDLQLRGLTLTSCRHWGHRVLTGTHSAGSLRSKWLSLLLADTELEKHLVPLFLFFCLSVEYLCFRFSASVANDDSSIQTNKVVSLYFQWVSWVIFCQRWYSKRWSMQSCTESPFLWLHHVCNAQAFCDCLNADLHCAIYIRGTSTQCNSQCIFGGGYP